MDAADESVMPPTGRAGSVVTRIGELRRDRNCRRSWRRRSPRPSASRRPIQGPVSHRRNEFQQRLHPQEFLPAVLVSPGSSRRRCWSAWSRRQAAEHSADGRGHGIEPPSQRNQVIPMISSGVSGWPSITPLAIAAQLVIGVLLLFGDTRAGRRLPSLHRQPIRRVARMQDLVFPGEELLEHGEGQPIRSRKSADRIDLGRSQGRCRPRPGCEPSIISTASALTLGSAASGARQG